jgi:hypothetical protein
MLDLAFLTTQFARSSEGDMAAMRAAVKKVRADLVRMESGVDRSMASGYPGGRYDYSFAAAAFSVDSRAIKVIAAHMDPLARDAANNLVDVAQVMSHGAFTFSHAGRALNAKVARDVARQQREDLARFDAANDILTAAMSGGHGLAVVQAVALVASGLFSVVLVALLILAARSTSRAYLPH